MRRSSSLKFKTPYCLHRTKSLFKLTPPLLEVRLINPRISWKLRGIGQGNERHPFEFQLVKHAEKSVPRRLGKVLNLTSFTSRRSSARLDAGHRQHVTPH